VWNLSGIFALDGGVVYVEVSSTLAERILEIMGREFESLQDISF
jgi:hypothetical protein